MSSMMCSLVIALAATGQAEVSYRPGTINPEELSYQQEAFKQWWGTDLITKIDELPKEGIVPTFRVPYSGHDYPDRSGGTIGAMLKYDRAFNRAPMATEYERRDVSAHRNGRDDRPVRRGLFGRVIERHDPVPGWYGHCNGWTAASIRHAEPQKSVVRNGVVFTPSDIKAMLAEIYMYSSTEFLGGMDDAINPATLHLTLGNWLGNGAYPVGMEAALGEVVINYPIYSYGSTIKELPNNQVEVKMSIRYAMNTNREVDKAPKMNRVMYFHYVLDLDEDRNITGGRYFGDSGRVDMLWTPLKPVQGGKKGNERGNPYLKVDEVLAIWRDSVSEDLRKKWLNVDPTELDRVLPEESAAEQPVADSSEASVETPLAESRASQPERTAPPPEPRAVPISNEAASTAVAM